MAGGAPAGGGPVKVTLREVRDADLETFFVDQLDEAAAALGGLKRRTRDEYFAHMAKVRADAANVLRTIELDGEVAGNVGIWPDEGHRNLGYAVSRRFWGRGVGSEAVRLLLEQVSGPLRAMVSPANVASARVLEKNGFTLVQRTEDDLVYVRAG